MTLEACPKCQTDNIFVPLTSAVGYDGKLYGSRTEGFCNNTFCDQRFWYYPHSGRITRRNGGMSLKEWRLRRVDVDVINAIRQRQGLPHLVVAPVGLLVVDGPPAESIVARLRRWLADWRAWLAAYWRVYQPFGKREVSDE